MYESEKVKKSKLKISLIVTGFVLILIGILSFFTKIVNILQEKVDIISNINVFIPGLILFFVGTFIVTIGMHSKDLKKYFGKLCISIAAFFLSGAMILLALNTEVESISTNIQPTLDTVIIDYIYSENGTDIEILQNLLSTKSTFEELKVGELTEKQNTFIAESFKINQIEELTEEEKKELPDKVISSIYNALEGQNQEEILNSPLPINEIIKFLESSGNLELTLLSMSYLTDINEDAKLILMIPTKNQNSTPNQNLNDLRSQCDELEPNQICQAFSLSKYENLIEYLTENESLPIEINLTSLEDINTIDKLEIDMKEKTSFFQEFVLGFIFFLLLGYVILDRKKRIEEKTPHIKVFQIIDTSFLKYFIMPTIVISMLFVLLKLDLLVNGFQDIIEIILNTKLPITLGSLPIIENISSIVSKLFIFHILIFAILMITYFILKKYEQA